MKISVVYATPNEQVEIPWEVEPNCSVALAIRRSGILERFPEINFPHVSVGIFSKRVALDTPLTEGDRIEIYRPLMMDPKQARRLRLKK